MVPKLRALPVLAGISHAPPEQKRMVVRPDRQEPQATPYIQQRLSEIKSEMGAKLICHPNYVPNPRHSHNPEIYQPARADYLASIAAAAQRDRERNPAFHLANGIRNVIQGAQA